jgi:hypothetical protein
MGAESVGPVRFGVSEQEQKQIGQISAGSPEVACGFAPLDFGGLAVPDCGSAFSAAIGVLKALGDLG